MRSVSSTIFPFFMSFQYLMIAIIKNTGIWIAAYQETRTLKMRMQVKWKKKQTWKQRCQVLCQCSSTGLFAYFVLSQDCSGYCHRRPWTAHSSALSLLWIVGIVRKSFYLEQKIKSLIGCKCLLAFKHNIGHYWESHWLQESRWHLHLSVESRLKVAIDVE